MTRLPTQLSLYVGLLHHAETTLAEALRTVASGHVGDADVYYTCRLLAEWSDQHVARLAPMVEKYGEQQADEAMRLYADGFPEVREGPIGLLRDLQDLTLLVTLVSSSWTVVAQAAQGNRDADLGELAKGCNATTARQLAWLNDRIKWVAPQALLVS